MKSIDFTKPGGFPLTQDQLGYLQTAFAEVMPNIVGYRNAGTYVAVCLAGMVFSGAGPYSITSGWFIYNGALIRMAAGSVPFIPGGHAIYEQLNSSSGNLTFNDGSTPGVINDTYGSLVTLASTTPDSSTVFLLTHLQGFCRESAWTVETFSSYIAGLAATGTISYKKDYLSNTLMLKGSLTTPSGGITLAGTAGYIDDVGNGTLMFTLPVGYRPSSRASFTVDINGPGASESVWAASPDPSGPFAIYGPFLLTNFIGTVESNGNVYLKFLNGGGPWIATHSFNFIISLD